MSSEDADKVVAKLRSAIADPAFVGTDLMANGELKVESCGDFEYVDLDNIVSKNQGLYIKFTNGARTVVRLSGTGSSGATIRLYLEKYDESRDVIQLNAQTYLAKYTAEISQFLQLKEFIGRDKPDVIT